ncbi:hypothetical protein AVEN_133243-1, partial [Araneus ventricosus]
TICGAPVAAFENKNSQYLKAISWLSEKFMVRVYNFFLWPEFIFKHTHYYKELQHNLKVLHDFSRSVIREKKDRYLRGGNNSDKRKRKALMDMLLERHFEFQDLNEEDIREEVDTFIMERPLRITFFLYSNRNSPESAVLVLEGKIWKNRNGYTMCEREARFILKRDRHEKFSFSINPLAIDLEETLKDPGKKSAGAW